MHIYGEIVRLTWHLATCVQIFETVLKGLTIRGSIVGASQHVIDFHQYKDTCVCRVLRCRDSSIISKAFTFFHEHTHVTM